MKFYVLLCGANYLTTDAGDLWTSWASLDNSGQLWTALDIFGRLWPSLDKLEIFGHLCVSLNSSGRLWDISGQL